MVIVAFIVGVGVIVELCTIMKAPLGYQDDSGFHVGAPDSKPDQVHGLNAS